MAHLIDKAAVVAEIEKYISNYKGILNKVDKSSDDWVDSTVNLESKIDVLQHILSFIDALEVKEVKEPSDAFIEKACELLERMVWEVTYEDLEGNSVQHYDKMEFIEDFKNYMKGE